jgi:hypothetical protein
MWSATCKPIGAELQALLPPNPNTGHEAKGSNICPSRFRSCFSLIYPLYLPILPFWNGNVYSVLWHDGKMKLAFWYLQELTAKKWLDFHRRIWTWAFEGHQNCYDFRDSWRMTKYTLHYEIGHEPRQGGVAEVECYGLRRCVCEPSWQGVDLWWLLLIVNLIRLRNF